jgi:hypothetical protein
MPSSHPLPPSCHPFSRLASVLDPRSAPRLAWLLVGAVLARGRRTVTSWTRAAGLSGEFRPCYTTVAAVGRRTDGMAARLVHEVVKPLVAGAARLTFALDDTPTPRYGRKVQGAGVHHNPTPGPAGGPFVYGHVWVVLGLLATHPAWGVVALPLLARLYVRAKDLAGIHPTHRPAFRTKLEMAVGLMRWAVTWLGFLGKPLWVVADGAYAKAPFLKPMRSLGVTVVSRLRKDSNLRSVPVARPGRRAGPGSTGRTGSTWPSGAASGAGGRRARSPCTASRRPSGTRRSWRRGGRPAGPSGWCWWTSRRGGRRSSAPTRPPGWPTSSGTWPCGSAWKSRSGI